MTFPSVTNFTTWTKEVNPELNIYIRNDAISTTSNIQRNFRQIIPQSIFFFTKHENAIKKVKERNITLNAISGINWGNDK